MCRHIHTSFAIVLLLACVPATAQSQVRELHPLLAYIFFDSGSATIPDRYHLFSSAEQTGSFSEASLPPNSLDIHHDILNIIGSRMHNHPETKIEIVGCNSQQPEMGEVQDVSARRGQAVYDYLIKVWKIDSQRIKLLPPRGYPQFRSNIRDPLGIVENRRAEIRSEDWEIVKPIITSDTTSYPELGDSTLDIYSLILFKFDSPEMGPINERIVSEYILAGLRKGAQIHVAAYSDVIGICDHCGYLRNRRANTVINAIKQNAKPGIIALLEGTGVGEEAPLYSNDLPEGRFYNRCVQVRVIMP